MVGSGIRGRAIGDAPCGSGVPIGARVISRNRVPTKVWQLQRAAVGDGGLAGAEAGCPSIELVS